MLKEWEMGKQDIPTDIYNRIISFPQNHHSIIPHEDIVDLHK
jgi:hypothetical protein